MPLRILVVDNYDSFTYNMVHALAIVTGVEPDVVRNDSLTWEQFRAARYGAVVLSPGPGHPGRERDFGICRRIIEEANLPVLGVCLGCQGIAWAFGGRVSKGSEPVHGKASRILHRGGPLFAGIPEEFRAIRYHSLVCEEPLPECLEPLASAKDGSLMALRHRTRPLWGVQFHPESVCSEYGLELLANFVRLAGGEAIERRREHKTSAAPVRSGWFGTCSHTSDTSGTFAELFGDEPYAFWLDGSDTSGYSVVGTGTPAEPEFVAPTGTPVPFPLAGGYAGFITYEGQHHWIRVERFAVISTPLKTASRGATRQIPLLQPSLCEAEYKAAIHECLRAIREGESYEVCLTNRLRLSTRIDPLAYYHALRQINPAPYSAYFRFGDLSIACSSPELFLRVSADGRVTSKPIKGTLARSEDPDRLRSDEKSRAENMMIVDLVRNDLSRVCVPGSVVVRNLMDVETYATVHQMVSTIEGQLRPGQTAADAIRAAFPPGSMTGAPKTRTMEIIESLEPEPRGVYSGAIGWIGLDGSMELNVAIRTAVFQNGVASIGTGGAIVAGSSPDAEWDEIQLKTKALAEAFTLIP